MQTIAALDFAQGPITLVLIPRIAMRGLYRFHPIGPEHLRGASRAIHKLPIVENFRRENSPHRAADAKLSHQRADYRAVAPRPHQSRAVSAPSRLCKYSCFAEHDPITTTWLWVSGRYARAA